MTLHRDQQDQFVLREFIQREIETINAYMVMLDKVESEPLKRLLAHAILEEKEHVAEGMQLLGRLDAMQGRALAEDHTPHLADDGPGARALADLVPYRAEEAGDSVAARADSSAAGASAEPPGAARIPSPAGGEFDAGIDAPDAVKSRRAGDAFRDFTVGSLRGKGQDETS